MWWYTDILTNVYLHLFAHYDYYVYIYIYLYIHTSVCIHISSSHLKNQTLISPLQMMRRTEWLKLPNKKLGESKTTITNKLASWKRTFSHLKKWMFGILHIIFLLGPGLFFMRLLAVSFRECNRKQQDSQAMGPILLVVPWDGHVDTWRTGGLWRVGLREVAGLLNQLAYLWKYVQIIWQTTSCLSESHWFCFTNFDRLLKGERLCIGSYWKSSKSLKICHVLDGEIILSMWCCRFLTDGTPSLKYCMKVLGHALLLLFPSYGPFFLIWNDPKHSISLSQQPRLWLVAGGAAPGRGAGEAAFKTACVNCNFQCLRHRDFLEARNESYG